MNLTKILTWFFYSLAVILVLFGGVFLYAAFFNTMQTDPSYTKGLGIAFSLICFFFGSLAAGSGYLIRRKMEQLDK